MNLIKPIVFLDIKTHINNDGRSYISELAAVKITPEGIREEKHRVLGETYSQSIDKPHFLTIAKGVNSFLKGCDLVGYDLLDHILPSLSEGIINKDLTPSFDNAEVRFIDLRKLIALGLIDWKKINDIEDKSIIMVYNYIDLIDSLFKDTEQEDLVGLYHSKCFPQLSLYDFGGYVCINQAGEFVFTKGEKEGNKVKDEVVYAKELISSVEYTDTKQKLRLLIR